MTILYAKNNICTSKKKGGGGKETRLSLRRYKTESANRGGGDGWRLAAAGAPWTLVAISIVCAPAEPTPADTFWSVAVLDTRFPDDAAPTLERNANERERTIGGGTRMLEGHASTCGERRARSLAECCSRMWIYPGKWEKEEKGKSILDTFPKFLTLWRDKRSFLAIFVERKRKHGVKF